MAQITWRNVDAPNFSGSLDGFKTFSDLVSRAGNTATNALNVYDESTSNGVNQGIRAAMQKYQDPAAMQKALSAGTFLQGVDPRRVNNDTFNAMDKRTGDLTSQNTNLYNINRTQEGNRQLDAAAPAVNSYLGAAALGDTAGMRKSLEQNASAFGGLRPDVYMKMLSDSAGTARSGVDMRNDFYGQSAANVASEILPQIGVPGDVEGLLAGNANYQALPAASKLAVQDRLRGAGYNPQGSTASVVPGNSANGAGAAIGNTVGTSRADRNANPGNLKAPEGTWVRSAPGFVGVDDGGFAKFDTPASGLAAMVTQLNRYREGTQATGGKAVKTVEGIIGTWSPTSDPKNTPGSTNNYIKYVADKLGLKSGDEVPADKMQAMAQAMYEFESGNKGSTDAATGLTDAAKRAQLTTAAQLNSAGASAALDAKMALSMRNLTGIAPMIEKAGGKLDNPTDVATALATQFKDVPHATLLGEVKRVSKEYKIAPALAGEILLGGGMGDHLGSGFLGLRKAKDFLMGDKFLGTGYAPDEEFIRTTANALKTPMAQSQAAENRDIAAIGAAVDSAKDKFAVAYEEHKQLLVRAKDNHALAKSVLSSEQRLGIATQRLQDAVLRQDNTKVAKQEFTENPSNAPKAIAQTIAGKATQQSGAPVSVDSPVTSDELARLNGYLSGSVSPVVPTPSVTPVEFQARIDQSRKVKQVAAKL